MSRDGKCALTHICGESATPFSVCNVQYCFCHKTGELINYLTYVSRGTGGKLSH